MVCLSVACLLLYHNTLLVSLIFQFWPCFSTFITLGLESTIYVHNAKPYKLLAFLSVSGGLELDDL